MEEKIKTIEKLIEKYNTDCFDLHYIEYAQLCTEYQIIHGRSPINLTSYELIKEIEKFLVNSLAYEIVKTLEKEEIKNG